MKHTKATAIIAAIAILGMGSAVAQNQPINPNNPANNPAWQPQATEQQAQPNIRPAQQQTQNNAQPIQNNAQPNIHQGQTNQRQMATLPNQPQPSLAGQPQGQPTPQQTAKPLAVGDTLPKDYQGQSHRVNHKTHGLPAPAKNQAWVQVDGRYLLVNVLTNAIVQVLLNN